MQPDLIDYDNFDASDIPTRDAFSIDDEASAAWAIRKTRAASDRITKAERLAEGEWDRIKHWLESSTKSDRDSVEFFTGLLTEFHARVLADDPTCKSIKLPHGTLTSRAQQDAWEIDAEQFIPWARTHAPEVLIEQGPSIDKKAAKAYLLETGEEAPGVTITARGPSFTVKTSK